MKKSFIIAMLMSVFTLVTAQAQTFKLLNGEGYLKSTVNHATTDTITNTTPEYQYVNIDGYHDVITIQPTITKISGTVGGTLKLQGSVDNVGYTDIASQTYTATDTATQTATFTCNPSIFRWYRISYVGSGTQSAKIKTPVIARKKPSN